MWHNAHPHLVSAQPLSLSSGKCIVWDFQNRGVGGFDPRAWLGTWWVYHIQMWRSSAMCGCGGNGMDSKSQTNKEMSNMRTLEKLEVFVQGICVNASNFKIISTIREWFPYRRNASPSVVRSRGKCGASSKCASSFPFLKKMCYWIVCELSPHVWPIHDPLYWHFKSCGPNIGGFMSWVSYLQTYSTPSPKFYALRSHVWCLKQYPHNSVAG